LSSFRRFNVIFLGAVDFAVDLDAFDAAFLDRLDVDVVFFRAADL